MAACGLSSSSIKEADVVGTWRGDGGGEITFASDKTFTADGLKNEVFDDYQKPGEPRSGEGVWSLTDFSGCLALTFDRLSQAKGRTGQPMSCSKQGGSLRIYFIVGDPDDHNFYYFVK